MEGIGWVAYETLKRITRQHPEHDFYFIFDRKPHPDFIFGENVHPVVAFPPARHPFLYYCWFEHAIPAKLKKLKADLFFSPDGYLSLKSDVKQVNIFHDLNIEHRPADVPLWERKYYQCFFPRYASKAHHIITVSEYTKKDVAEKFNIDLNKISVVHNGVNEVFRKIPEALQRAVKLKYTKGYDYFIFVGAFNPRKNLVNLFRAFDRFCEKTSLEIHLLIVGEKMYWTKEIQQAYDHMTHKHKVVFSGRLGMDQLVDVMGSAIALTYVSFLEGFGIPIVEAFRAGIPVITSNVTSMPEVAGDAALFANPYEIESIAGAMQKLVGDQKLREELVEKGFQRVKMFSWDHSADKIWNILEKVMNDKL